MMSSMSVPICNHFHVRRAYSGKITLFKRGAPLSPPRSPLPSGMKYNRLSYGENPKSLFYLVLNWYQVVTDRRTDRITVANTRYSYASCRA